MAGSKMKKRPRSWKSYFFLTLFAGVMILLSVIVIAIASYNNSYSFVANSTTSLGYQNISNLTMKAWNETWLNFVNSTTYVGLGNKPSFYFNNSLNYTFIAEVFVNSGSGNTMDIYRQTSSSGGIEFFAGGTGIGLYDPKYNKQYRTGVLNGGLWSGVGNLTKVSCVYVGIPSNSTTCYVNAIAVAVLGNDWNWSLINSSSGDSYVSSNGSRPFNSSIYSFSIVLNNSDFTDELNYLYMPNFDRYSLNVSDVGINSSSIFRFNDSVLYSTSGLNISKSVNNGLTWTVGSKFSDYGLGVGKVFVNRNKTIFVASTGTGNLSVSMGNENNWTQVAVFPARNQSGIDFGTGAKWGMTETKTGALLIGQYNPNFNTSIYNGSFILRSIDGGLIWNVAYNSTAYGWNGRHIHLVSTDPYTGYIYATQGDGVPQSRLIRSTDDGLTWTSLLNGTNDAQFLTAVYNKSCRIFGTDSASGNKLVRTCDDINFQTIYSLPTTMEGYVWSMEQFNNTIIAGTTASNVNKYYGFIISPDFGSTWFTIASGKATVVNDGISMIISFDSNGNSIYYNSNLSLSQKFNILNSGNYNPIVDLRFNENNGTIAYDSSGNGNNGTISGATWQNDGVLKTLTNSVDYTLDAANGLLSVSQPYLYSWLMTTFNSNANPHLSISSPISKTYNQNNIDFNVSLDEDGSNCYYSLNGAANVSIPQTGILSQFSLVGASVSDGSYAAVISCNDTFNNWGDSTINFKVRTGVYVYQCDPLTQTAYGLILVLAAIALFGAVAFYVFKDGWEDIDTNKLLILFIAIVVGVILFKISADNLGMGIC